MTDDVAKPEGLAQSAAPPAPAREEEFDWINDPDVVQHDVPCVAIYCNAVGQVVIRQERQAYDDYDQAVRIDPRNAVKVAQAILQAAGVADVEVAARRRPHRAQPQQSQAGTHIPGLLAAE